jgi:hypothetical protein
MKPQQILIDLFLFFLFFIKKGIVLHVFRLGCMIWVRVEGNLQLPIIWVVKVEPKVFLFQIRIPCVWYHFRGDTIFFFERLTILLIKRNSTRGTLPTLYKKNTIKYISFDWSINFRPN